jgi:hypothetical protein
MKQSNDLIIHKQAPTEDIMNVHVIICLKWIAFHSYYIDIPPESTSNKHPRYDYLTSLSAVLCN